MELPKEIEKKIEKYAEHARKSNQLLKEINDWFGTKGINTGEVSSIGQSEEYDFDGATVQDILIDTAQSGDIIRGIKMIKDEISSI